MFTLVSPTSPVVIDTPVAVHLRYTHEGDYLPAGAALRIGMNTNDGAHFRLPTDNVVHPPVVVEGAARLRDFRSAWLRSITHFPGAGVSDLVILDFEITADGLRAGDCLDIILGRDARGEAVFVPGIACDSPLELFFYLDPDGRFPPVALHPDAPNYQQYMAPDGSAFPEWRSCRIAVALLPDRPQMVDIMLPSVAAVGERLQLRLVCYDKFNNHVPYWAGELALLNPHGGATEGVQLTATSFTTGAEGYALIPITFTRAGLVSQLAFHISDLGVVAANPVRVTNTAASRVCWGDLHGHCNLSDGGMRGPDAFFRYAREIRGLDFAALADHAFGLAVCGHWQRLREAIKKFAASPDFVPILGYEIMTNGHGHRNVYFPGTEGTLVMADYQPGSGGSFAGEAIPAYRMIWDPAVPKVPTLAEFFALTEQTPLLYTAHHCGKLAAGETERITLYEACSEWGISEEGPRQNTSTATLNTIFAQRLSPGLTGGSDDHHARAGFLGAGFQGGPIRYPSGLTAVICPTRDRHSIYDALRRKQCYAATGARILLEPAVNWQNNRLHVRLHVVGTGRLDRIWVFKNGAQVHHVYCGPQAEWILDWDDADCQMGDVCYIRITQMDGQTAWINPLPFAVK